VVITAASGLGGVTLGGWLTNRAATAGEDKRQAFHREQERRDQERAFLQATRLVFDELSRASAMIEVALETADDEFLWPSRPGRELPQEQWQAYRGVLATAPDDMWAALTAAYIHLTFMDQLAPERYPTGGAEGPGELHKLGAVALVREHVRYGEPWSTPTPRP
jgi:hypothetical protein